ncbi:hypothetical protein COLU111180_04080 [Cohnella lubricantis]|uniref:Phage tail tape measure protein n=1 Tax=Cohnella lubricantis TaxID=2163172 RepID=A0A841T4M8_9BACL|nr:hypothetical protein [Cohnella lubricantis]MBB6676513.1 hypothetical protein [Cohnella lubricantis]MBP2117133.1 hypothetical protein [Cohnella lubricantis]
MGTQIGELRARMIAEASQMKSEIAEVKKGITGLGEEGQKTSKAFDTMSSSLGQIAQNTSALKSIDEQLKKLDPSKVEKGLDAIVAELQKMGQASKQAEKVGDELKDTGTAAKQAEASFEGLNAALGQLGIDAKKIDAINTEIRKANPKILEKQLQAVRDQLRGIGLDAKQIEQIEKELKETDKSTRQAKGSMEGLGSAVAAVGAGATFVKLTATIKSLADEAQQLSMAYSGLSAVSKSLNVDVEKSADLADELADRWGLSRTEMANTVKTYLAAGMTLDQTREIMIATADAAAYNRQANLSWGEAINQVAQGIKMGNSDLTDAAGITTNLSVMYDRYAQTIGKSAANLTEAEKIQAAYNGMLQEGAMFAGNADDAMTGYTGTQATFNQTLQEARIELGEDFLPVLQELLDTVTPLIREFASFADGNEEVVAGIAAASVAVMGFIALIGALSTAFLVLNTAMGGIGVILTLIGAAAAGITAYSLAADAAAESVWKFAQNQDELNKKLAESPLSRSTDDVKKLQDDIDTLNKKLEEQKNLQDQISKLNDQRNQLVISNGSNGEVYKLYRQISDLKSNLSDVDDQLSQLGIKTPDDAAKRLKELNDQLEASIPALVKLEEANLRDTAAQVKHIDSVAKLKDQYEQLDKQTKLTTEQKAELANIVKQLTQEYPGLQSELDEEGRWHIRNTDLINDLIQAERDSVAETADAAKKRLETWKSETEAKLKLAKAQVKALMSAAGVDLEDTEIGSKLPSGLAKGLDFAGDLAMRAVAEKAQSNVNDYQLLINQIEQDIQNITSGAFDKFGGADGGAGGGTGSGGTSKTVADIQQEQYQAALKFLQYKKDLNQVSEQQEMDYLNRMQTKYKNNADIRQDLEVKVYQLQQQMNQESFEASEEWIEQEERRMTLAGKNEDEITQMKLDAWTRVRSRYAKDTDYYKQADTEVYNLKVDLIKAAQQVQEAAAKQQEQDVDDLLKSTTDAIKKQKQAQLDAIDEQRKAIEDYYDAQQALIDQGERQRQRDALNAERAKYANATSEAGKKHLQELDEQLRQMDLDDQKDALAKERDQKLASLDRQKDDIEAWYDELESIIDDYKGDAIKIYQALEDDRFKAFTTTNSKIRAELEKLAADYANIMGGTGAAASSSGAAQTSGSSSASVVAQMQANSIAWRNATTDAEKASYAAANEQLGASIGAHKNSATGKWYDSNGMPLFHGGRDGVTGLNFRSPDQLMPDEITAILRDTEYVFTPEQLKSLVNASGSTATIHIEKIMEVNDPVFEDGIDLRTFGRETGDTAAEILRKNITGGG